MRILITENQRRILFEETENVDNFLSELSTYFNLSPESLSVIKKDIESSGCGKIEFRYFKIRGVGGASLPDGVLINRMIRDLNIGDVIFTIFHEIAHQYQYKKYGNDFSYKLYNNDIDMKEAIGKLRNIEEIADNFGIRKYREYSKRGIINGSMPHNSGYNEYKDDDFKHLILTMQKIIRDAGVTSTEEITTMFYNWLVHPEAASNIEKRVKNNDIDLRSQEKKDKSNKNFDRSNRSNEFTINEGVYDKYE